MTTFALHPPQMRLTARAMTTQTLFVVALFAREDLIGACMRTLRPDFVGFLMAATATQGADVVGEMLLALGLARGKGKKGSQSDQEQPSQQYAKSGFCE